MRDARQKGQVARSQEVVTTISLFGVIAVIFGLFSYVWTRLVLLMDGVAAIATDLNESSLHAAILLAWDAGVAILLPILGAVIALAIAGNYIQVGVLFSFETITPKLEKISFSSGFKRIFSMKQVVELLKSVFKIVFLSFLLYFVMKDAIGPYISAIACDMECIAAVTDAMLTRTLAIAAVVFVVVAGLDFMFQRHSHTKQLMMTKEEVKREYKEAEGDPIVKGQRKQLAQEMVMSDAPMQAGKASAVVVNPTRFAVAIRYREGDTPLPLITALGRNHIAHQMRAEAERAGVPIFRNPPLARQLYAESIPGEFVPDEMFDVIAEILAWVGRNEARLYHGPLDHGDIDMERGDHRPAKRG